MGYLIACQTLNLKDFWLSYIDFYYQTLLQNQIIGVKILTSLVKKNENITKSLLNQKGNIKFVQI